MLAGRVVEYKPAAKRSLDEVKPQIIARLTQSESEALAAKEGEARLAALKAADSVAGFSDVKIVSRAKQQDIPPQALAQIMKADTQKLPAYVGVALGSGGYQLYRIAKVMAGTPDPARRASEAQQMTNLVAQQDLTSFIELLKKKAKVSVNKSALSSPAPTIQ